MHSFHSRKFGFFEFSYTLRVEFLANLHENACRVWQTDGMDCAIGTTDRLSSVSLLMGVESKFGAADARAVDRQTDKKTHTHTHPQTNASAIAKTGHLHSKLSWRPVKTVRNNFEILRAYCIFMVKYIHGLFVGDVSIVFRLNSWWKCSKDVIPQRPFSLMHCSGAQ